VGPQPHLPGGSLLTYVELDFCDTSPTGRVSLYLQDCDYLGACEDSPLVTLSTTDGGAPGCGLLTADLTPLNYTVDNFTRQLLPFVDTTAGDATTVFLGAIYGYRLQVSPAPATPTFSDVPVGHQFYRYVEALVDAGITAGCGGGLYCPNSPLTRGQMAVFLSIALGLHWPQ
jgi:hypothetical protein